MSARTRPMTAGVLFAATVLCAAPTDVRASEDLGARPHKGILLQAGEGVTWSRSRQDWGLSLPSLTVGTYVRRNLVIGAHFSGATHIKHLFGVHPYAFMFGFYGPMMQYWWVDRVYLGISVGLNFYTQRNSFALGSWVDTVSGFGLAGKLGVTAFGWDGGRINVFGEVLPAVFRTDVQLSTLMGVEWQAP